MDRIKHIIGGAWASAPVRTAIQAGLAIVVASGTGYVNVATWKAAALAAGAALFARLQASARG